MNNHTDNGTLRDTRAPRVAPRPARRARILLAEDNLEMRRMLAWSLEHSGYEVSECGDGFTVLRRLGLMDPGRPEPAYDLVISDVRMPGYTGLQVLESMRACSGCPPVVLISAFADAATRERADSMGAALLLPKPFDVDDLLVAVRRLLPPPLSTSGPQPEPESDDLPPPGFPLEITVRHGHIGAPVEAFISQQARRFDRLGDEVRGCRVVIETAGAAHDQVRRTGIRLIIDTRSGRPLVVGCETEPGDGDEGLYMTLQTVFATAWRLLTERHARRRPRAADDKRGEH